MRCQVPVINNAVVVNGTIAFPNFLAVTCDEGYELVPRDQVLPQCGPDGLFTLPAPICYGEITGFLTGFQLCISATGVKLYRQGELHVANAFVAFVPWRIEATCCTVV